MKSLTKQALCLCLSLTLVFGLAACSAVEVLEPVYTPGCMLRRNRAMVQRASLLISVFDVTRGGTASTLRFAAKQGIEILPLWM